MIRQATIEDLEGIVEVAFQVQQYHWVTRPTRFRDTPRHEIADRLRALLSDPEHTILVADVAKELLGYVVIRRIDDPGNVYARPRVVTHVDALGVRLDVRRAGHGRALLAAVEDQARAWGADGVVLDVLTFNQSAAAFYAALGYSCSSHRMSKPLG